MGKEKYIYLKASENQALFAYDGHDPDNIVISNEMNFYPEWVEKYHVNTAKVSECAERWDYLYRGEKEYSVFGKSDVESFFF